MRPPVDVGIPNYLITASLALQMGLPARSLAAFLDAFDARFRHKSVNGDTQREVVAFIGDYIQGLDA